MEHWFELRILERIHCAVRLSIAYHSLMLAVSLLDKLRIR